MKASDALKWRMHLSSQITSVVLMLIKAGSFVAIFYLGYLSISALAGHSTFADIAVKFVGDLKFSKGLAWIFGTTGVVYGIGQRKVRRDTVERLHGRIRKFEQEKDPSRGSSELTPRGETNPKDKQ